MDKYLKYKKKYLELQLAGFKRGSRSNKIAIAPSYGYDEGTPSSGYHEEEASDFGESELRPVAGVSPPRRQRIPYSLFSPRGEVVPILTEEQKEEQKRAQIKQKKEQTEAELKQKDEQLALFCKQKEEFKKNIDGYESLLKLIEDLPEDIKTYENTFTELITFLQKKQEEHPTITTQLDNIMEVIQKDDNTTNKIKAFNKYIKNTTSKVNKEATKISLKQYKRKLTELQKQIANLVSDILSLKSTINRYNLL